MSPLPALDLGVDVPAAVPGTASPTGSPVAPTVHVSGTVSVTS